MCPQSITTRREFLRCISVLAAGSVLPRFLYDLAWAENEGTVALGKERILVVVQLSGGNDGLNTLVPYADDAYYRARPTLAIARTQVVRVDEHVGFHPVLVPLNDLLQKQKLCIIEGVGYPNPDRSHFRSMEIWHTASDANEFLTQGWIGRYLDATCSGRPDPVAAIAVGQDRPQAFTGRLGLGVAVSDPTSYGWHGPAQEEAHKAFRALNAPDAGAPAPNPNLQFLRMVATNAVVSADRIGSAWGKAKNAASYPQDQFSQALATVARLIAANLPTRIYYVALGGFDTHANQSPTQERLLKQFAEGLAAFQRDLDALGLADRVLTMTFSEFGRRVAENGSAGTDHGTAQPLFLVGKHVRPGLTGKRPSLTDLDNGDLRFTTDFRSVYATVLEKWLDTQSSLVLGKSFPVLDLLSKPQGALRSQQA